MVRGSLSEAEQRAWNRLLGSGFVLVVGGSAGLTALFGGATLGEAVALSAFGLLLGAGLLWYLSRLDWSQSRPRRRRR